MNPPHGKHGGPHHEGEPDGDADDAPGTKSSKSHHHKSQGQSSGDAPGGQPAGAPGVQPAGAPGGSSQPTSPSGSQPGGAVVLPACSPPDVRTPPTFRVPFRRPLVLKTLNNFDITQMVDPTTQPPSLGCIAITNSTVELVLDPLFDQVWTLNQLSIGDLASTIGLAPGEQLTLEIQQTQRKVFDQSVADSTDSLRTTESQTSDKEAVNVTRASTKTEGWHIDGTGTVSTGKASLAVSGGYSSNTTQSFQSSIDRVSEATKKSSESLKTLHQIQVHGTSETMTSSRMTRVIKNPYFDRTLSVNVFQLIKHFTVQTQLEEVRTAVIFTIIDVEFDASFALSNADFLRNSLLDTGLLNSLDVALQGAQPPVLTGDLATAGRFARRALQLLFSDAVNIFHMAPRFGVDPNLPSISYKADATPSFLESGLGDAHVTNFGLIFTTLNFYYTLATTDSAGNPVNVLTLPDADAIQIATSLAGDMKDKMTLLLTDPKDPATSSDIKDIIDDQQLTEGVRRMFGFVAMVNGILLPLMQPASKDAATLQAQYVARFTLERLLRHLECNRKYYIQALLQYLSEKTKNYAISDFVRNYLAQPDIANALFATPVSEFDPDGAYVSQNSIVVPALDPLDATGLATLGRELFKDSSPVLQPTPTAVDVEVPADGVHLEVAPGGCVLPGVPPPSAEVSLSLQNASLNAKSG